MDMEDDVTQVPSGSGRDQRTRLDLEHQPDLVLSLLEDDQLVAAKESTTFGRMELSPAIQAVLWGLRVYVVLMLLLVVVQVIHALGG